MITEANNELRTWLAGIGCKSITQAPPTSAAASGDVNCYLFDISPCPSYNDNKQVGHGFELRFLLTLKEEPLELRDQLLDKLLGAAVSDEQIELDAAPGDPQFWRALELSRRPALVLRRRAQLLSERKPAPLVRGAMQVSYQPVRAIAGQLLGPDAQPLAAATVGLPDAGISAKTGRDGWFRFTTLADMAQQQSLVIQIKGRRLALADVDLGRQPLVIHVTAQEIEDAHI